VLNKKRLILHLGTHKAGSTSVQLYLHHNREALAALGICYPLAPPPTHFAHHGLPWVYIQQHTGVTNRPGNYPLADALQQFQATGCHTLLLSSEDFLTCTPYPDFLENFFLELRNTFDTITVCAFVRGRKAFFTSSYNQWIKSLSYTKDFESYLQQTLSGGRSVMHYTNSLDQWAQQADESVYLAFAPEQFTRSVEEELLAALGVDDNQRRHFSTFSAQPQNVSIDALAVLGYRTLVLELQQKAWFDHSDLMKRGPYEKNLRRYFIESNNQAERLTVFNQTRLEQIRLRFGAQDEHFAKRYFGRNWCSVFPNDTLSDVVTEKQFDTLTPSEHRQLEAFVHYGLETAEALYNAPPNSLD